MWGSLEIFWMITLFINIYSPNKNTVKIIIVLVAFFEANIISLKITSSNARKIYDITDREIKSFKYEKLIPESSSVKKINIKTNAIKNIKR